MRHRVYGRHFGRNKDERTALFKTLVQSLFVTESIQTTQAKAKSIKGLVDKLINQAKSPATRRLIHQFIISKEISGKLIKDIAPRFKGRTSGYTSIIKVGKRAGDGADMVRMSLIEGPVKQEASSKQQVVREKKEIVKKITKPRTRAVKSVGKAP